jgi:SAM-dependent methyltransferase
MLYVILLFLNRFEKKSGIYGLIIWILVYIQSILMWVGKKEFRSFSDCLFHNRKQVRHPWINERAIEYPWVYKNILDLESSRVLDVGAKEGLPITDMLLENNNIVYAIDINASGSYQKGNLIIEKGDILSTSFEENFFDAVIAVSTLEHIGIPGRYGISGADESGDLKAMQEIFRILKPAGKVLITVPYGMGKSLPLNRLYKRNRIIKLFNKFEILKSQYFRFKPTYRLWFEVSEPIAAQNNWDCEPWYALACFYAIKRQSQVNS